MMMDLHPDEVRMVSELRAVKAHGFGHVTAKVQDGRAMCVEAMKQIKLA